MVAHALTAMNHLRKYQWKRTWFEKRNMRELWAMTLITPRQKSISTTSLTIGRRPAWCTPIPLRSRCWTLTTCSKHLYGTFNFKSQFDLTRLEKHLRLQNLWKVSIRSLQAWKCLVTENTNFALLGTASEVGPWQIICWFITSILWKAKYNHL